MRVYDYLRNFGMYEPNRNTWEIFLELKRRDMWKVVGRLFDKYRKLWSGPDISIYIFPLNTKSTFLGRTWRLKSGVSFIDKIFLFLTPLDDEIEIEALFVHEYHHVCRMNKQSKSIERYTLLDSMVLEGLAEYAVEKHCGKNYLAEWCSSYTDQELKKFWDKYIIHNIDVNKKEREHDEILFGLGRYPKLLGYAIGYKVVSGYGKLRHFSTKTTFDISSEELIKNTKI